MDPNQHIKDYLKYYLSFTKPPQFAVLLNGDWGIGKTYLIKDFINSLPDDFPKPIYVSLYGISSIDDINDAIFRSAFPLLNHKGIQFTGRAMQAAGKFFRVDLAQVTEGMLNKPKADLYIFDDLERCNLPINISLGYINEFIEHEGRKVIIIANEKEIHNGGNEKYKSIREKVIGKTLEIQSVFEQALNAFISLIDNKNTKEFILLKKDIVSNIYYQSGLNNLRIMQQSIWDFERFYISLDDYHRKNDAAMTFLLSFLFAFSFEVKCGRLIESDFSDREQSEYNYISYALDSNEDQVSLPPFETAKARYPQLNLSSTVISDKTLINLLIKGFVNAEEISNELDVSTFFVIAANEPSWRTIWYRLERTYEEFSNAILKMEATFLAREFKLKGEILHVIGIRIWLAKNKLIKKSINMVINECYKYIDDIYENEEIENISINKLSVASFSEESHEKLSYYESKDDSFKKLNEYLVEKINSIHIKQYPKIAIELLDTIKKSPELFFSRINFFTNRNNDELTRIPILADIKCTDFIEVFFNLHPKSQHIVLIALQNRYEGGQLEGQLSKEKEWVLNIRQNLLSTSNTMSICAKFQIQQLLQLTIDKVPGILPVGVQ